MAQPGSLRECSVSFSNRAATSASCPTFAIQVTANTTIVRSLPAGRSAGEVILGFLRGCLQLRNEFIHQDGMVAIRSGGDHADFCAGFLLDEREVFPRLFGELFIFRDALGRSLPSPQLLVNALDFLPVTGLH